MSSEAAAPDVRAESRSSPGTRVTVYVVLVLALSATMWIPLIRAGTLTAGGGALTFGLMWCPALAALLASLATRRPLSAIGWRFDARWILVAVFAPIAYAVVAYGAVWALGLGGVPNHEFLARLQSRFGGTAGAAFGKYLGIQATVGLLISCIAGLGEEIGWRGFLVPELSRRYSFAKTSLLSGVVWSVWHYPVLLFADYNGGTPAAWSLACFTVMVLGISFLFAASRLGSGGVWPAAILHGSHNLFIQSVLDPITSDTGRTKWWIGEFGAALAVAAIGVAALTVAWWRRAGAADARRTGEIA